MDDPSTGPAETAPGIDELLQQLDDVIHRLEMERLPVEEALRLFKQGHALYQDINARLKAVEQEVQILLDARGTTESQDSYRSRSEH